jgi:hypothetical protein
MAKKKPAPVEVLKGWTAIAKFLGTSPASGQTWAKQGMPVKREGDSRLPIPVSSTVSKVGNDGPECAEESVAAQDDPAQSSLF